MVTRVVGLVVGLVVGTACGGPGVRTDAPRMMEPRACEPVTAAELVLRGHGAPRRTGPIEIRPSSEDSRRLLAARPRGARGPQVAVVEVRVCVDPTGTVVSAEITEPSGLPDWDQRVLEGYRGSTYCPYQAAPGRAPLCDRAKMIFELQDPRPDGASVEPGGPAF